MPRSSSRVGVAQILAAVVDAAGRPVFKSVYDRMPPRIPEQLTPAVFVMLPNDLDKRRSTQTKLITYQAHARIWFAGPSVGWGGEGAGANHNLFLAPATDPQVLFDDLIDALKDAFRRHNSFAQDTPGAGFQVVSLGEPEMKVSMSEPEKRGEYVVLAAIVEFPVVEQVLGV